MNYGAISLNIVNVSALYKKDLCTKNPKTRCDIIKANNTLAYSLFGSKGHTRIVAVLHSQLSF